MGAQAKMLPGQKLLWKTQYGSGGGRSLLDIISKPQLLYQITEKFKGW